VAQMSSTKFLSYITNTTSTEHNTYMYKDVLANNNWHANCEMKS